LIINVFLLYYNTTYVRRTVPVFWRLFYRSSASVGKADRDVATAKDSLSPTPNLWGGLRALFITK